MTDGEAIDAAEDGLFESEIQDNRADARRHVAKEITCIFRIEQS